MKQLTRWFTFIVVVAVSCFWVSSSMGADKIRVRILGGFGNQVQSTMIERPFWEELAKETADKLDIQFHTRDELGLKGYDDLRKLKSGVFDIVCIDPAYVSGDDLFWDGMNLIGLAPDLQTGREVMESMRAAGNERLKKLWNGMLIFTWTNATQVYYFKDKLKGVADFKGRKIRVFSRATANVVEYFGAKAVTLPFPEVYPALQRGVIEAGVTGILTGNTARWWEVTNYLYPMAMGQGAMFHTANLNFWNKLDPDMQKFLTKRFKEVEEKFWKYGFEFYQQGINCNTGKGPCKLGVKGNMTLVPVTPEDQEKMKECGRNVVLPEWAKIANNVDPNIVQIWNQTAGKVLDIQYTRD
ncbi:MAG: TRAP transporter substrate-binding protein [Deltaproteobacteria bacterium]|nr:TRAP transporter substrate-binding protein [Deltaproteobacteria bacterium]